MIKGKFITLEGGEGSLYSVWLKCKLLGIIFVCIMM